MCGEENDLAAQSLSPCSLCSPHYISGALIAATAQNKEAPTAATAGSSPQSTSTSMGRESLSGLFTNEPLLSQKPNVSF